jgi:1,4-alpha-glucan branching enzyme
MININYQTSVNKEWATLLSDYDINLFKQGKHYKLYEKLGAHFMKYNGQEGVYFAVWAPNAEKVFLTGDFNYWDKQANPMNVRFDGSGIWETFIPGIKAGTLYKYHIHSNNNGYKVDKADPFGFMWETPPNTASVVWDIDYTWKDKKYLNGRKTKNNIDSPFSVYEVHMGSWKRKPEENNKSLTYKELAESLPSYIKEMGFTHVEFMPVMEHPFYGSWGYQVTGYFAPSSRYGTPQDFMHLIDELHKNDVGVILDWVPSHFPADEHGLVYFDGTHLFEHEDPRKGFHPDWKSYIFNLGRNEIRAFLISNALFWLDKYHADGLRVDGVASMLYLNYSREEGEWIPNEYGGNENLETISFIKEFNETVYEYFPDVQTIAEESTAFPQISRPTFTGGLGFGMKWMMGWMHDTLDYMQKDPIHRQYHQDQITFSILYAFTENFMLPLSHDEVVYGKNSLIGKMPGDEWQRFANLRTLYAYMFAHPGSNLIFMGGEIAQYNEWSHESSLDWHLLEFDFHKGVQQTIKDLNTIYKKEKALFENQFDNAGFEWIDASDYQSSVISFVRKGKQAKDMILVVCNFTPAVRKDYHIGVPKNGTWREIFNSDAKKYNGSGTHNPSVIKSTKKHVHGREHALKLTLPPMGVVYMKYEGL